VPDELRKDPFLTDSVPWSIREAEIERQRGREKTMWMIAMIVSWVVTFVILLHVV
jgi:hypothetical protein